MGYGGSCFPKDVKALIRMGESAGLEMSMVRAIDGVNEQQKLLLLPRLREFLGTLAGKVVAVWGLAFKPRTDDTREAPALALIEGMLAEGASVRAYDPKAMPAARHVLGERVAFTARGYDAVDGADALVVATEWSEFREPDFLRIRERMRRPAIFDGRNLYSPQTLRDLGFHYEGIGRR
jgi:UDPglucose 6-dehydrogenase